jgi:nitroimidazol reductase NimA-like FMN-containing flavoprotein (pyridoxamine 5'-phosphate oxidase superfamily)
VEQLDHEACWELLADAEIGRVAFASETDIEVFPVNFLVHERTILFRSAPGTKLALVLERPRAAFEADGVTPTRAWSVVVHGRAERLSADDDIEASGVLDLATFAPGEKDNFVRIVPDRVTGRRFRRADA